MNKQDDNRRSFLKKVFVSSAGMALLPSALEAKEEAQITQIIQPPREKEWRNKRDGMAYRMFGNTGMMVSEVVQGTDFWKDKTAFDTFNVAFEKGVNYLDTAPAYTKGMAEKLVGQYLKDTKNRQNIFLSNKISFYDGFVNNLGKDIYKGLPAAKQAELEKRSRAMVAERGVLKPGYHFYYWPQQADKLYETYLSYVVIKEYGGMRKWKSDIQKRMYQLVDNSLKATQTDYFDVLHCPHGTAMPDMLDDENIKEVMAELKKKGVVRFAALSMHNDVAANLEKAIQLGHYDAAMIAYNIGNHASLDRLVRKAKQAGMGIVAMKVAKIIHDKNTPQWRIDKLNSVVEGDLSKYGKAYLWALQNPNLSCCISDMKTEQMVRENTALAGKRIELKDL